VSLGLAIALMGMTTLAVAILLVPLLLRQRFGGSREAYNLTVYRDQLAEIGRDIDRGVLTAEQAEAARAEIGRRILALNPAEQPAAAVTSPVPFAAAIVAVIALPFAAWTIYAALGSPGVPDQPYASRGKANPPTTTAEASPPHDMSEILGRLRKHLAEQPTDVNGWLLLARSTMSLNRFAEAADAYRHAAELSAGQSPEGRLDIIGDWGEAQVLAAGGVVTPQAREAFEKTLEDPENAPRSRYYLALAAQQQGDVKGALQKWVDLEADSPGDADYLAMLRQRITTAATTLGLDPAALKTSSGAPRGPTGPTAPVATAQAAPAPASSTPDPQRVREAEKALQNAPPEDRQAMINSMVERLATRLEQQPDDLEGWVRLGRSYMVLGQPQKAREAYAHAVKLRPDDPGLKKAYAEADAAAK